MTVTIVAIANAGVWVTLLTLNWHHILHRSILPDGLRQAIVVAILAASIGSAVSALGFVAVWDAEWSAWLSAAWRVAMLAAGLYGLAATWKGRSTR